MSYITSVRPFPHNKNHYFTKRIPFYRTLFYSVRPLARIRQRYFSKYGWGRMHGPSPSGQDILQGCYNRENSILYVQETLYGLVLTIGYSWPTNAFIHSRICKAPLHAETYSEAPQAQPRRNKLVLSYILAERVFNILRQEADLQGWMGQQWKMRDAAYI